jgi:hypothetical protein
MITSARIASVVLLVLSIAVAREAFAEPPNASMISAPIASPAPALRDFGLHMGATTPAMSELSALWMSLTTLAAERTCINHCPPASWSVLDPSLGPLGKISGAGIAMRAGGAGLAIGRIALRNTRSSSGLRNLLRTLAIKPMAGGVGLSISF